MLNLKSLFTKILTEGVFKDGATMTGQIKTSYKDYIACGSYSTNTTTIPDLINEVRYSSGCMGFIITTSDYRTSNPIIKAGYYDFLYIPHRFGGTNGTATGDNCNYGNLLLIRNNPAPAGIQYNTRCYIIRLDGGSIAEVKEINTSCAYSYSSPSATSNSYYSLNERSSYKYSHEGSHLHTITLYVNCTTKQSSWQNIGVYSTNFKVGNDFNFSLTNSAGTVLHGYLGTNGNIYVKGGYNGHGFKGTITYMTTD